MRLERYLRIPGAIAFIAVAALLFAACSSDDGDQSASTTEAPVEDVVDDEAAGHEDEAAHDEGEAAHEDDAAAHEDEAAHEEAPARDPAAEGVDQIIEVTMTDFAYEADVPLEVAAGSTVKFVFTNEGAVEHETTIGDLHAQEEAEAMMAAMAAGETMDGHTHGEVPNVSVAPGETGELTVTFGEAGQESIMGCHYAGHWEAGMRADITVV